MYNTQGFFSNFDYSYDVNDIKNKNKEEFLKEIKNLYQPVYSKESEGNNDKIIKLTNSMLKYIPLSRICCNRKLRDTEYEDNKKPLIIIPTINGPRLHKIKLTENNLKKLCKKLNNELKNKMNNSNLKKIISEDYYLGESDTMYNEKYTGRKTDKDKKNPTLCDIFYLSYCKFLQYLTNNQNNFDANIAQYGINSKYHNNECGCINSNFEKNLNNVDSSRNLKSAEISPCFDLNCNTEQDALTYVPNQMLKYYEGNKCSPVKICAKNLKINKSNLKKKNIIIDSSCNTGNSTDKQYNNTCLHKGVIAMLSSLLFLIIIIIIIIAINLFNSSKK